MQPSSQPVAFSVANSNLEMGLLESSEESGSPDTIERFAQMEHPLM